MAAPGGGAFGQEQRVDTSEASATHHGCEVNGAARVTLARERLESGPGFGPGPGEAWLHDGIGPLVQIGRVERGRIDLEARLLEHDAGGQGAQVSLHLRMGG